jgi:long-chain acyl-CoA synthetase
MPLTDVAGEAPDRHAIVMAASGETVSFGELNGRVNQLVRTLRARGLAAGDAVAVVVSNRPEFAETVLAATRAGMRVTPINWHLTGEEIAYIVDDCEARAFIADVQFDRAAAEAVELAPSAAVRLAVGGEIDGFESYDKALAAEDATDIDDPTPGGTMLYTSGTTGRPKGVHRDRAAAARQQAAGAAVDRFRTDYRPGTSVHLATGPLYHAAPLAFSCTAPLNAGVTVVLMEKWDARQTLELIERHRVTHSHMVPTMFHRLLALPDDVKASHDLSSLRHILHAAAPCPVPVKSAMIEWWGPIIHEYYAATEGFGTHVLADEWLEHPGTVGKVPEGHIEVRGPDGDVLPRGEIGVLYLRAPEAGRFEYYKAPEKTAEAYRGDYFTLGDVGYVDEDGYLFLTDRSADLIIAGGVNIYPAEIDAVLLTHPKVADVATVGVPNEEWGEEVKAVVEVKPGTEASGVLAQELIDFCADRLARYKVPRSVDFVDDLPRHDTGKIYRRLVRERYRL